MSLIHSTTRQKAALDAVHRFLADYPDPGTFSYRGMSPGYASRDFSWHDFIALRKAGAFVLVSKSNKHTICRLA